MIKKRCLLLLNGNSQVARFSISGFAAKVQEGSNIVLESGIQKRILFSVKNKDTDHNKT